MSSAAALQIWDNAAFDPSINLNLDLDLDVEQSKENQNPLNLDAEIAAIESEIARLSKNLHSLRLLKQSQLKNSNKIAVPSKFLNLQTPKNQDSLRRRGMSIGQSEILRQTSKITELRKGVATVGPKNGAPVKGSGCVRPRTLFAEEEILGQGSKIRRRGMSIGPSEILASKNPRRGMSIGPSEILRQTSRITELRNGIATVGPKARKIDGLGSGIVKPKTLFTEEKRRSKGRVVASRYSLPSGSKKNRDEGGSKRREWSPPETAMVEIGDGLPKIKTVRMVGMESPRDSGRAKKVAELVGKKSFFSEEGSSLSSSSSTSLSCQRLSFED